MLAERLTTASIARWISLAYGAAARIRCCALMIRDAAISSWARVILAVDLIAEIRCRTARSCAPMRYLPALARRLGGGRRDVLLHGLGAFLRQGLGRLVRHQHAAAGDFEAPPELLDRVLQRHLGVVGQLAGLLDRVVDTLVLAADFTEELLLEAAEVIDGHVVEVAAGPRPH